MNMLDMHTREQVNRIHLKEMHQDSEKRRLLRKARQNSNREGMPARWKQRLAYVSAFMILFVLLLLTYVASL